MKGQKLKFNSLFFMQLDLTEFFQEFEGRSSIVMRLLGVQMVQWRKKLANRVQIRDWLVISNFAKTH